MGDDGDIDPPGKKKGVNVSKSNSDAVKTANEASAYGEAAVEFTKQGLISRRSAMPLSSKIGTFKTFSKYFKYVKTSASGIGLFSYGTTGASVLLDYNSYLNGDISGAVLTYNTTGNVATTAASFFNPVAGLGAGIAFKIGEIWVNTMDHWTNVVNNANNLNWLYNAR